MQSNIYGYKTTLAFENGELVGLAFADDYDAYLDLENDLVGSELSDINNMTVEELTESDQNEWVEQYLSGFTEDYCSVVHTNDLLAARQYLDLIGLTGWSCIQEYPPPPHDTLKSWIQAEAKRLAAQAEEDE